MTHDILHPHTDLLVWGKLLHRQSLMFHYAIGERLGMSATEHKAADILWCFGAMTAGELASRTGLTTGAITGLVDRLEGEGFVRREQDQTDRRRVIVQPVREKYRELESLFSHLQSALAQLLENYSQDEAAVIADFAAHTADLLHDEAERLRQDNA